MPIYTTRKDLNKVIRDYKKKSQHIGFVPTMGALHKGHLSLVQQALDQNDIAVVSVFVNPTQFDNISDLEKYPRTLTEDEKLLYSLDKKVIIFAPTATDLYNGDVRSKSYRYGGIENEMEGRYRTGHFDGVGTVVNLLLRAVQPDRAYFGQKDFQQLQIVKKLVEIEKLKTTIVGCPIVRENNGLAMSSRNKRLTKVQFEEATIISRTLREVKEKFISLSISQLNALVKQRFQENSHLELEYFEIANEQNLKTAQRKRKGNIYRGFIAAFAGEVRLIDNMQLN